MGKVMEKLNEFYESHIGRVHVAFVISAKKLNPDTITDLVGVEPDSTATFGEHLKDYKGNDLPDLHEQGFWKISSRKNINSKDVNEHFRYILDILLPFSQELIIQVNEINGESGFDVLWESSYLYAGTGPILSKDTINDVSKFDSSIGFGIYQISENAN